MLLLPFRPLIFSATIFILADVHGLAMHWLMGLQLSSSRKGLATDITLVWIFGGIMSGSMGSEALLVNIIFLAGGALVRGLS